MGLKVSMEGLRFRRGDVLSEHRIRDILRRRLSNTAAVRLRPGDSLENLAEILKQRGPIDLRIYGEEVSSKLVLSRPEMIDDRRLPFKVAVDVFFGSLENGMALAEMINRQNPGSALRIPSEEELLELNVLLKGRLRGEEYWVWTTTRHNVFPNQYILRHSGNSFRNCSPAEVDGNNGNNYAVRFVEDK